MECCIRTMSRMNLLSIGFNDILEDVLQHFSRCLMPGWLLHGFGSVRRQAIWAVAVDALINGKVVGQFRLLMR